MAKILLDKKLFKAIVQKGTNPHDDSYSGFQDDGGKKTQLDKILKKENDYQLVLVGKLPEAYNQIIDNDPDLRDTSRPGFVSDRELAAWYKAAKVFNMMRPCLFNINTIERKTAEWR